MTQVGFTLPPWKSEDQARRQREFCAGDPDSPIRCAAGTGTVRCLASPPNALCTPWLRPVAPRAGRHRVPLLRPRPRRCRRSALATPRGQPEQRRRVDDPARGRAVSPDGPPAPRAGRVAVVTAGSSAPVSFPPGWPRAAGRSLTREAAAAPAFRLPQPGGGFFVPVNPSRVPRRRLRYEHSTQRAQLRVRLSPCIEGDNLNSISTS